MATNIYTFVDSNGVITEVQESALNFAGVWSQPVSYYRYDVVTYLGGRFMCLTANSGRFPPTATQFDSYWSILSFTSTGTATSGTNAGAGVPEWVMQWIDQTYNMAIHGTQTGEEAYGIAYTALHTAWAGTGGVPGSYDDAGIYTLARAGTAAGDAAYAVARPALDTAWDGTAAGAAAYAVARTALDTAWIGTAASAAYNDAGIYALARSGTAAGAAAYAVARTALDTAWDGTAAGAAAYAVARPALDTSWSGTAAGAAAYAVARTALDTAWAGTGASAAYDDAGIYALARSGTQTAEEAYGIAYTALDTAWDGTAAGAAAYSIARPALDTAWDGTAAGAAAYAVARTALDTAWDGTAAGAAAYAVARPALDTSWAGTQAASAAYAVARTALDTAWAGTSNTLASLTDVSIPSPTSKQVLTYSGSLWVAADPAESVSVGLFTLYLDDTYSGTTGTAPYVTLSTVPVGTPEVLDTVALNNSTLALDGYISGYLNRTVLNAGVWEFNTYASVSVAARPCVIFVDAYRRSLAGVETYLFSGTSASITSTTAQLWGSLVTTGTYAVATTDKLVFKYYGRRVGSAVSLTLYHNGQTHASHVYTPIGISHNDLSGLQGGGSGDYYHVTFGQNEALNAAVNPNASNPFVTQSVMATELAPISEVARTALDTAWAGTAAGAAAYAVARTALDTAWEGTQAASAAYNVAYTALDTAWDGTAAGAAAYSVARPALDTAWDGTAAGAAAYAVARPALDTAWAGTAAGAAAYAVARTALDTAWAGTGAGAGVPEWVMQWIDQTYNMAIHGTQTAEEAYGIAYTALNTAWAGTGAGPSGGVPEWVMQWIDQTYNMAIHGTQTAEQAYGIANTALVTAWAGTLGGSADTAETLTWASSVNLDFSSAAYKTLSVLGNTTFTSSNLDSAKSIGVRIFGAWGSATTIAFPAGWVFLGQSAPTILSAGSVSMLACSSWGATDSSVLASWVARA